MRHKFILLGKFLRVRLKFATVIVSWDWFFFFFLKYLFISLAVSCLICSTWSLSLVRHAGLSAPRHVEASRTGDRTHVPCTGRQILIHCTTREALEILCIFKTTFKIEGVFCLLCHVFAWVLSHLIGWQEGKQWDPSVIVRAGSF